MLRAGPVRALGAMSGTSLDGVDVAVIETDGQDIFGFGPSAYRPYSEAERAVLSAHLGRWQGDDVSKAATVVLDAHTDAMADFECIDLVGFHGQTLAHDPGVGRTHQCGDGAALAARLSLPVVWDFRTDDVKAGGQGAPLAPFYHFALAKWIGAEVPLAFLNLGGVGNITFVDPSRDSPEEPGALLAFDTGPANAPINDLVQRVFGQPFDAEGALAAEGRPDAHILAGFLAHPYFAKPPPKSLDRDDFAALLQAVADLRPADAAATLTMAIVRSVEAGLALCPQRPERLLITGGGRKNAALMRWLEQTLPCAVQPVEAAGLDGDMLEAQAFAYLAVRSVRGLPLSAAGTTGAPRPMRGGKLSSVPA